jgi:hypothetical protein
MNPRLGIEPSESNYTYFELILAKETKDVIIHVSFQYYLFELFVTGYVMDVAYHVGVPVPRDVVKGTKIFYQLELTLNQQSSDNDDSSKERETLLPKVYSI